MQCNEHFCCLDSFWHCMFVGEGSVITAYDSDQLWNVLEVTPHGIPTLDGAVQEFDLVGDFVLHRWCEVDPFEHRRRLARLAGDCCRWEASSIRAARVSTHARTSMSLDCTVRSTNWATLCFHNPLEISAEGGFPNRAACHLGKLVTELDISFAGCKPRSLRGRIALPMTCALPHLTEQQVEEVIYNRGVTVHLRESLVIEEDIAAADDILDADESEAAMEEAMKGRAAKSKSEAREATCKVATVTEPSAAPKTSACDGSNISFRTRAHLVIFCRSSRAIDLESSWCVLDKVAYTLQEAQAFVPTVQGCSLCIASSGVAWQIPYLTRRVPP